MKTITVKVIRHNHENAGWEVIDTITRKVQRQSATDELGRRRAYRAKFITYKRKRYDVMYIPTTRRLLPCRSNYSPGTVAKKP